MAYSVTVFRQGKQLKFARQYRCFTQTELCKNIEGLSQSNLSRFEKGLVDLSEETKKDIMDFLGFPMDFLSIRIADIVIL